MAAALRFKNSLYALTDHMCTFDVNCIGNAGLTEAFRYDKITKCVSKMNNRGCSNAGEESPGFIGQDAG